MEAPLVKTGLSSVDSTDAEAMGVKTFGPVLTVAMALNYMIGTGCFGLPYAFSIAGIGLTSLFVIVGYMGALITQNYTLEAMARADGVATAAPGALPLNRLTFNKYGFSRIGEIFDGKRGYVTVQSVLVCYCLGSLWSYASIFASSTASVFFTYVLDDVCDVYAPHTSIGCMEAYYICMLLFTVMTITLVLMDLGDQAVIQKFLSAYRIIAFGIMFVTMAFKLSVDGASAVSDRLAAREHWAFNLRNFGAGFGPTLLALNCQYNMPDLLQPLEFSKKGLVRRITYTSISISAFCYFMLGFLGSIAFDNVNPLATLMWTDFSGCGNGWSVCASGRPTWYGSVVHIIVVMFPVMNVASSFPMIGLTVAGNILPSLPKAITAPLGPRRTQDFSRVLAVTPPLLLATIFKKLDAIFTYAGILGFAIGLIIPSWFQVVSVKYCRRVYGNTEAEKTPFTAPVLSSLAFSTGFLYAMFVVTFVAVVSLFA
ncbi:hypothetical protein SPRG_04887 [Saprolegnia parasitica CBS 223.65]|uniref:Amino acid transporter transmembrane domain-containing protein n=1 Tax=Saprolegnia parasitica (strain CBS 223.65) TaxID=695850 RepID=A0A067CKR1_SAPPC|nr:hypothetical protein SPRG_04887 [Saprolegnia parasitica CBS 223.65]KDO29770.1 hypothetical protein SPRG_04887 [Saprolegnia parasitica CBS 223.65]|eukprot:XP_012199418.1 hypothetical protein SPRG_04887 [Saprolegnia parasitica CBS 223.65]